MSVANLTTSVSIYLLMTTLVSIMTTMVNTEVDKKSRLLTKLMQREGELSDYKFAKKLGISRALWEFTRTGQKPIHLTLLKATIRTFPELCTEVIEFLRGEEEY